MDSILAEHDILDEKNWLYFKLYRDPSASSDWRPSLNWYHETLVTVVKPLVANNEAIRVVFFGTYGPELHEAEGEKYQRQIPIRHRNRNLKFIKLRLSVKKGSKTLVRTGVINAIKRSSLVWNYEVMNTYNVRNDLGNRYGSNIDDQTLQFVRFWDAGCRFILSIVTLQNNWAQGVDVWGIPHLVNNSLGAWLRPERGPVVCPSCTTHMYMCTHCTSAQPISVQLNEFPNCLFICPNCFQMLLIPHNI